MPTDRMKFDTQVEALRATCIASKNGQENVDVDMIASFMGVSAATAGLNNAFYVSVGLLEKVGRGEYKPKDIALGFTRQWSFDPKEAPKQLAPAFAKTWFFDAVKQRVQVGPTTVPQMIETLAALAETDASYTTQLGSLLDWLEFVGLISTANGTVVVLAQPDDPGEQIRRNLHNLGEQQRREAVAAEATAADLVPLAPEGAGATVIQTERPATVVSLAFQMNVTTDDLAKLSSEQIGSLFEGVGKIAAVKAALEKN